MENDYMTAKSISIDRLKQISTRLRQARQTLLETGDEWNAVSKECEHSRSNGICFYRGAHELCMYTSCPLLYGRSGCSVERAGIE